MEPCSSCYYVAMHDGGRPGLESTVFERQHAARVEALVKRALFGPDPETDAVLRIARYSLLRRLGRGATGVVYAAHDATLDRRVAVKLLRRRGGDDSEQELLREAQAAARLAHPNVVTVFEVGTSDGSVYMAMELVEGTTLADPTYRDWSWRAVLELYQQAGAGLAAAHRAGLVHRDFKPANVAVDSAGRARVLDFGLARSEPAASAGTEGASEIDLPEGAVVTTCAGTPAYLAPDVWAGAPPTRASDQYSFCVALYEAVSGSHPFIAADGELDRDAMARGRPTTGRTERRVPKRLRRALLRGLRAAPEERWPSMDALLDELRVVVGVRRRRIALGLAAVAMLAGVAGAELSGDRGDDPCSGARALFANAWGAAKGDRVRDSIRSTGVPYADDVAGNVARRFEVRADEWARAYEDTCRAQRSGLLTETVFEQRLACFDRVRRVTGALADELARADAAVVERAVQAVSALSPVRRCTDDELVAGTIEPPSDELAADVEAVDDLTARARAALLAGRYEEARSLAEQALARARQAAYSPALARALVVFGDAVARAGEPGAAVAELEQGFALALRSGMNDEAEAASTRLASVVGDLQGDFSAGRTWGEVAVALALRPGGSPEGRGRAYTALGGVYDRARRGDEAIVALRKALVIERARDSRGVGVAAALNSLGVALSNYGALDEAKESLAEAYEIYKGALGPGHPQLAKILTNQSNLALREGRASDAIALVQAALDIRRKALGEDHWFTGRSYAALGNAHRVAGDLDAAAEDLERSLAILTSALGPKDWSVAVVLGSLGRVQIEREEFGQAAENYRRALEIDEGTLGPEHPDVAYSLAGYGRALVLQGEFERAVAPLERALALPRADRFVENDAQARFMLARALWALGKQRGRAAKLAREALAKAREFKWEEFVADIETWMGQRSLRLAGAGGDVEGRTGAVDADLAAKPDAEGNPDVAADAEP